MYSSNKDTALGCLIVILIFALIYGFIKAFWWLIVGVIVIAIVYYYGKLIVQMVYQKRMNVCDSTQDAPMGEVYKVCPYCNAKVKVTAKSCPQCNRALN